MAVDDQVLQAAVDDGTLLANDLALGRRARNLGARWLRTADLVVLLAETGRSSAGEARGARVDAYAARHREDRSTAIRQLLDRALRELAKAEALEAYVGGRVTLRDFAATLGLDTWQAHDLLASEGVAIAQGDMEETASDLDAAIADLA